MKSFAYLPIAASMAAFVAALSPDITTVSIPLPSGFEPTRTPQTGCPTVTSTRELCATCPVPACLVLATSTQSCGCPTPVPTVYLDYPCSEGCKNIWCSTSHSILYETNCPTTTTATLTTQPTSSVKPSQTTTVSDEDTSSCEPEETETKTDGTITTTYWHTRTATSSKPIVTSSSTALNQTVSRTSSAPTSSTSFVLSNNAGRMRVFGGWGLGW